MEDEPHQCAELLSAAFQIPDFLILKGETERCFADSIYKRIFTNWFAADEGSSTNYEVDSLISVRVFLSELATALRNNLHFVDDRNSNAEPVTCLIFPDQANLG